MVIDDSVSVCKAVERMVAPRDAEVIAIHSGREALARLEKEAPDLVICDLLLPDLESFGVFHFVRESAELRRVPVVAITGLGSDQARRSALAAGADAVLKKPFRSEELLAEVNALLAGARESVPPAIRGVLGEMELLDGLAGGGWWLATGAQGRLRAHTDDRAADPAAMLARLRSFAAPLGIQQPSIAVVENDGGDLALIAQRDRRGVVFLRLGSAAMLGKARFLARKFLYHLDRLELTPSTSTEAGAGLRADPVRSFNQRS